MNDPGLFSGLVLFGLLSVIGRLILSVTWNHLGTLPFQIKLFLYAFALRFAMSIVLYQLGLVEVLRDEDSGGWLGGVSFYQLWERQGVGLLDLPLVLTGAFEGHHRGYQYLLGVFFYVTDAPARLPAAVLNGFFGALIVVFTYRVAKSLFSPWVAVRVGWWTCLFPSMLIWSAQTVKEPVVILLEVVALYACVQLRLAGFSRRHVLLCVLTIIFLVPFRFYAVYIVATTIILSLGLPQIRKRKIRLGSALVVAAIAISLLSLSGVLAVHEAEFEQFDLEHIQKFRHDITLNAETGMAAGSGVQSSYDVRTPTGFGFAMAVGAAHLLLAPFPWQLAGKSLRLWLTLPELIVWWWLFFVGVLPGLRYAIRNRFSDIQPFLFIMLGLGLLYSVMFGNIGLVYRQRAQLLPWLLMLAMVGLEQRALRRLAVSRPRISGQVLARAQR